MHWTVQTAVWIADPTLELTTAVVMFRGGLWRQYPVFWSYLLAEVLRAALLFSIGNDRAHYFAYFYLYWITETLVCLLGFFVVAEVFRHAFSQQLGLQQWGKRLFRFSLLCVIVLALLAAAATHGSEANKLTAGILILKRFESLVRLCLVIALFAFVAVIGLPWNSYTIGIATGFAVYGIGECSAITARLEYGRSAKDFLTWAVMLTALCENLIWLAYFLPSRKSREDVISSLALNSSTAVSELMQAREALQSLMER